MFLPKCPATLVIAALALTQAATFAPAQGKKDLVPEELYRRRDEATKKLDAAGKLVKEARLEFEKNRPNLLPYWRRVLDAQFDRMVAEAKKFLAKQDQLNKQQAAIVEDLNKLNSRPNGSDALYRALSSRAKKNVKDWTTAREQTAARLRQMARAASKDLREALQAATSASEYLAKNKIGYDDQAPKKLSSVAKDLGEDTKEKYEKDENGTRCNIFLRDFARQLVGIDLPEFAGDTRANDMFDNLKASRNWKALDLQKDKQAAFQRAQEAANEGKLVVIAYKNPNPKKSGHVAVVVPSKDGLGKPGSWDVPIPYIAQAGEAVIAKGRLSEGFSVGRFPDMEIFILAPPASGTTDAKGVSQGK